MNGSVNADFAHILVVDDDPAQTEALRTFLKRAEPGWIVRTAQSGREAIKAVGDALHANQRIGVVVTDLCLSDETIDGSTVIREIQQVDPLAMTILYSAKSQLLSRLDTSSLDAFDVVLKTADGEASKRILERTRVALRFRNWAVRATFLSRYVDDGLFRRLEENPDFFTARSRDVTVVFWDLRGFSRLCDQLPAHSDLIAGFLREYSDSAATAIFEHHGVLDKYIGDGVMALFGLWDQTEAGRQQAAIEAVNAAIDLRRAFEAHVLRWTPRWQLRMAEAVGSIRLACGIHTGRAIVGNLGTKRRDQFTAVGSDVNFGQRLESEAGRAPGADILISAPTEGLVSRAFRTRLFKELPNVDNAPGVFPAYIVEI